MSSFAESLPSHQLEVEHGLCLKQDCDVFVVHLDPTDNVSEDDLWALDEVVEMPQHGLTDRQYEALTLPISRGFYESPRQVITEELAEEMDISQPSMSNLLRRGERQLLSSALEPQNHLNALSA